MHIGVTVGGLVTIAYISRATDEFRSREARQRLKFNARASNAKADISGMLIYCEGYFVQAIEGPAAAADGLFARIAKDIRHTDIELVARTEGDARVFGRWSMGFVETDELAEMPIVLSTRLQAIKHLQDKFPQVAAARYIEAFLYPASIRAPQSTAVESFPNVAPGILIT